MDYDLIVVKTLERVYKNYYYIIRGEKNESKNEILNSTTTFGGGIYSRTVKVYSFI